nr:GGDEF domain-containing protein [Lachnospiraceae bacterium]
DWNDVCSVFCCHLNIDGNEEFAKGEYSIFNLPDLSAFDGIIFVRNTFRSPSTDAALIERIKASGRPCVCIDCYHPDFINFISDECGNLGKITRHLIKTHDCRKIFFLGGPESSEDTKLRFKGFRDTLNDYGLEFQPEWAFYGNFEIASGNASAEYFLNLPGGLPDAVVACNDEMAVGLISEFKRRGIKVPKDVKVTGVDYDSVSRIFSPRLTTIKRQQYQKGLNSITALHEYKEHTPGETITSPIVLFCGDTCGCKHENEPSGVDAATTNALAVDKYTQSELTQYIKRMTAGLISKRDQHELYSALKNYTAIIHPEELYLCINVQPDYKIDYSDYSLALQELDHNDAAMYTSELVSTLSFVKGKVVYDQDGEYFERSDLFPPSANGGKPGSTYYFFPIHYMNRNFGYAILGDDGTLVRNDFFPNWCTIVSNALENCRTRTILEQMVSALDRMWIYDTLTGIYNRAGFFKLSEYTVADSIREQTPVCVIFLDVDGLKKVNDVYGHDEGDNLIKGVASVLKEVKRHGEIMMRYGGDEFVLLAPGYTDEQARKCIDQIEAGMETFNAQSSKPYLLEASIGYCITTLKNKDELNDLIENADREMYKNKAKRKAARRN